MAMGEQEILAEAIGNWIESEIEDYNHQVELSASEYISDYARDVIKRQAHEQLLSIDLAKKMLKSVGESGDGFE